MKTTNFRKKAEIHRRKKWTTYTKLYDVSRLYGKLDVFFQFSARTLPFCPAGAANHPKFSPQPRRRIYNEKVSVFHKRSTGAAQEGDGSEKTQEPNERTHGLDLETFLESARGHLFLGKRWSLASGAPAWRCGTAKRTPWDHPKCTGGFRTRSYEGQKTSPAGRRGKFQVVFSKLTPQLRQVTDSLPLPLGTRSCWPQLGHLK